MGHQPNYSDEVAGRIDEEIRGLIDHAHDEARAILEMHRSTLDRLAGSLVEKETLDTPELDEIFAGLPVWSANGEAKTKARAKPRSRSAAKPAPDGEPAKPAPRSRRVSPRPRTA